MPNHIQNRLTASPKVLAYLVGENGKVDFNKIRPQPSNIYLDALGEAERAICQLTGQPNWYDWNIANWGTKWNAYELDDKRDTETTVHFQTAWSRPLDLIYTLSTIFPAEVIEFAFSDEDSGSQCGKILINNGNCIDGIVPINGSKEAFEIFFELHPDSKDNYKLVNGKYQYVEED